jgi:nitrate/TMAO reductase-like tetraheme cytochrome c subunit
MWIYSALGKSPISSPLTWVTLLCVVGSAAIILWYLIARPQLDAPTKLWLLFGIAVLPIGAAVAGNVQGFQVSQERQFCSSCHVMLPYTDDASDPKSDSLAAIHGRNNFFGSRNCYTCHADYAMFGAVATKLNGLMHVWAYASEWHAIPLEESIGKIHLYQPYNDRNCVECHSMTAAVWRDQRDHKSALEELRTGKLTCMSEGCHGPAHPFSKPELAEKQRRARTSTIGEGEDR